MDKEIAEVLLSIVNVLKHSLTSDYAHQTFCNDDIREFKVIENRLTDIIDRETRS